MTTLFIDLYYITPQKVFMNLRDTFEMRLEAGVSPVSDVLSATLV